MKKKSLLLFLSMMVASTFSYGQNGLQQIIIEKYYVSNAADAANADGTLSGAGYATGTLPSGSVTWRIYADLEPGWGVQGAYGESGHPMVLTTSTSFFNHPNGNSTGGYLASNNALFLGDGTTLLDSYLSCGGVAPGRFGVLKSEDNSAAVPAGGGANVVFSPAGILANVDASAGLDINIADGHYNTNLVPTLLALTFIGDAASSAVNIFTDGSTVGGTFNTTNAYFGVLGHQQGAFPAGTNRVLLGQFTTKGILTYALNLQIRNTTTNVIQKYVSANATGSEIYMPSLSGILNAPSCIATASTTTASACSTYTWNGSTYTSSGVYVFNTANAAGCDSIATLNLTITAPPLWYADADNDSYGNLLVSQAACLQPSGFVANTADCNDANAAINPAATELCNGIDDDCDGLTDGADINVAPLGQLGAITGTLVECKPVGSGSTTISVPAVPTAVNYSWTVPAGLTIVSGQGTTSIVVSWTSASIDPVIRGNVSAVAADACGSTSTSTAYLEYATKVPVTPASISGSIKACPGDVVSYSLATVFRATSYNWTVPSGMTIISGAGTNVITVSVIAGYAGGTVSVNAANVCGNSPVRTRLVSLNMPNTPGLISGPANGVCGNTGVVYSIANVANAASYNWTVPAGATIASGQGTSSITVNFGGAFTTGQLTVISVNACGNSSARSLFVTSKPARPSAITGIVNPACGGQTYTYGVASVIGTTSYNWVVTPGGSISFPFPMVVNGKDASINWTLNAPAIQGVSVSASNACGTSPTRTASVTVNTCVRVADNNIVWSVYPNPAKDRATISFEATENAEYIVSMFDVTGRLVVRNQVNALSGNNTAELILSDLAAGVYSVVLQSTDAKSVMRLIVE